MSRHTQLRVPADAFTYEQLMLLWQSYDKPLTPDELRRLRRRRTPAIVVVARVVAAMIFLTVLLGLPPLLRTVGGA